MTQQKCRAVQNPKKSVGNNYFLSIEYFGDAYNAMELQTMSLHEWYAMSKIKFKNYKSFFKFILLLSGDIATNPGPTNYPCSKCGGGVRSGVLCTACNLWVHSRCEGLSRMQINSLSNLGGNLGFVCCVCRENQSEVTNIQANILDKLNVSAAIADDRVLVVAEQLETGTFPFREEIAPGKRAEFSISRGAPPKCIPGR